MALSYSSSFLSASTLSHSPFNPRFKGSPWCTKDCCCSLSVNLFRAPRNTAPKISCSINMSAGQSGDHWKIKVDHLMDKARRLWDSSPQPVKDFPWNKAFENFIQLILDLILAVVKYLSVPVLAISSLSEMSYCAHLKKLFLVPVPVLLGIAIAGVLNGTALELSPSLKNAEVPWHLIAVATFFTLVKLPGPYYPYWGRILIPHFANGVLLRTLWLAFLWNRRPREELKMTLQPKSVDESH
ncbi:Embryo defective protein [Quillaja saponaria]|uniref:Embryo defective protein n=1 Tax=Quillaja saponaria TaxID=32244 RepID=A0AAD7P8W3_QUISA|nr:Embryo defective protein [Quillaja saponaria]